MGRPTFVSVNRRNIEARAQHGYCLQCIVLYSDSHLGESTDGCCYVSVRLPSVGGADGVVQSTRH